MTQYIEDAEARYRSDEAFRDLVDCFTRLAVAAGFTSHEVQLAAVAVVCRLEAPNPEARLEHFPKTRTEP